MISKSVTKTVIVICDSDFEEQLTAQTDLRCAQNTARNERAQPN